MKKSKKLKAEILESLYPFLDGEDCDADMEEFENALEELIEQVEMETRIKKNKEEE